ncbi:bifunctional metallophosphatase/5'-nucleotidase [Cyclobacterium jeungdonense]|uniref:5'-nucleotidase C-terminal domain-containing protein n=1 Tax=Cyclobacterium jeungdonense TaxID=708087 RepID=A0ABT8C2J3_9BACT|nr:5'-nucleotidase C-terminal domain-containing protein [Cyclobacterium jeungdonense]MDN3686994.1 5'-nucleotidase C-terminal domain-containing protein [Cyclobacterium jeungdonense]
MELNILYLNDVHGYLEPHNELFYNNKGEFTETVGGYSRIATLVRQIRQNANPTLLFDGGDTFHGTLPLVKSQGEAIIPVLNELSFNAMVGHWDFAYGPNQLKKLISKLSYPMLGINVYNEDSSLFLQPFITIQLENLKIGVIGICSGIIDKAMPAQFSEGLKITDGMAELPVYVKQLKNDGVDIIILLSHNGFPQDMHMLQKIDGIDICLSAHTHNRLYKPVLVNNALLIQCGCHGSFLGHLKINIEGKQISGHQYELLKIAQHISPDSKMEKIIDTILQPYQRLKKNVIGFTESTLHRYDTMNSSMDKLLLKAIMYVSGTDISFSNGWRYGAPICSGNITEEDLFNIIPINPPVSTVDLTGQEIIDMLEENLERTFSKEPMKQMGGYVKRCAGLRINLRIENPVGHRIQEIYFNEEHLNPKEIYKVSFVTSQGVPKNIGKNRREMDRKAVEAMAAFLKDHPKFDPTDENLFALV